MKRLAVLLVLAGTLTFVGGSASEVQACKILKMLLHRCHACHSCGAYKCDYRKCDQPKCHCGHGGHGHAHGHHRRRLLPFFGPRYPEPAGPYVEEIPPGGRAF